jgi:hypothetical protein
VEEINQQNLEIDLRMTIIFYWNDNRLSKINSSMENDWQDITVQTAWDNIFIPDIYIYELNQQTTNSVFGRYSQSFYHGPNSTIRQMFFFT